MIEDSLREAGFQSFDLVCSAAEAIAAAERRCPDIITADANVATGTGIDIVQAICTGKAIPVIFVTAIPGDVLDRLSGAVVVQKPFRSMDLTQAALQIPLA